MSSLLEDIFLVAGVRGRRELSDLFALVRLCKSPIELQNVVVQVLKFVNALGELLEVDVLHFVLGGHWVVLMHFCCGGELFISRINLL